MYYESNELYHYGVKGMKWGVRKDPNVAKARANYKTAKKAYNKAFNKWYYTSSPGFTDKQRQSNARKYVDMTLKSDELGKAKGNLMVAKGKAKNNQKKINKGKYYVESYSNMKTYNTKIKDLMDKGYGYKAAIERTTIDRNKAISKQQDIDAKYRALRSK